MVEDDTYRAVEYEDAFLQEAEKTAQSRYNIWTGGFATAAKRRLEMGQRLYGNGFFKLSHGEQQEELLEESWDCGAYPALIAQARLHEGLEDNGDAWHLFEIACHAAAIHAHARALGREDD